jgi:hypothetical protein
MFLKKLIYTTSFVTLGLQNATFAQNQPLIASNLRPKMFDAPKARLMPIRPAPILDSTGLSQSKTQGAKVSYPPKVVKSAPAVASTTSNTPENMAQIANGNIKTDKTAAKPNSNVVIKTAPVASTNVAKSAPVASTNVAKSAPAASTNVAKTAPVASTNVAKTAPAASTNVAKTAPAASTNVAKSAPVASTNVAKTAPVASTNVAKTAPVASTNVAKTAPAASTNVVKTAPAASTNVAKSAPIANQNVAKSSNIDIKIAKNAPISNTTAAKPASIAKSQPTKAVRVTPALTNVNVRNATILNGEKDDFSPVLCENGILFCTNSLVRAKNGKIKKTPAPSVNDPKQKTQRDDLNLKFASFDSVTGQLSKVRTFDAKLNSRTNEGPSCFSKDGQTMYLTRNSSKRGKEITNAKGEVTVKIYVKQKQGDSWTGEILLPFEDEDYTFCHPTLSADGQKLYFTSNMPGGFGGMDLYVSRRLSNGTWAAPSNLGAKINTAKNELFPFISEAGTLFFASDGQEGAQKLDLYRIDLESKTAVTTALGAPFNTESDDFGLILLPNGKRGYFSSSRTGGFGGDDIYEFDIL